MIELNVNPTSSGKPIDNVIIDLRAFNPNDGSIKPIEPALRSQSNYYVSERPYPLAPLVLYGTVRASGYKEALFGPIQWDGKTTLDINVDMLPGFNKPSRAQIINVMANFCNLRDEEDIPIFEPFISPLITSGSPKAIDWINRLKAAGSTHVNINIAFDYNEFLGWAPRYPIFGHDYSDQIDIFGSILDWVSSRGLIPIIQLSADGQGFDPIGLTKGWSWGMQNFARIVSKLDRYVEAALWSPTMDGGFPDWSPSQTIQFLRMMRDVLGPSGNIATEFNGGPNESIGYCHMGNGAADWHNNQLDILDCFFIEVLRYPPPDEGLAQVATRLLGPHATNTPISPYFLEGLNKDINICHFESGPYQAIRKQITPEDCRNLADQAAKFGFKSFGSGLPHA